MQMSNIGARVLVASGLMLCFAMGPSDVASAQGVRATQPVETGARKKKYPYKIIPAVKCWMGSYDDDGNYTPGGCESTARAASSSAPASAWTQVRDCLQSGGQVVPHGQHGYACAATGSTGAASIDLDERAVVAMLRRCAPAGIVVDAKGLGCVGR